MANSNKEDIARFLHYIKQLETSGGKNLEHPTIHSGIHAGDTAEGEYGMMPNTMDEMRSRYPSSFNEQSAPEDYAKKLADQVLTKSGNDETLAAGLWNQGHNASPERFDEIRNSDYAQKYDKMRQQIPYSLDPNPYQEELKTEEEEKNKFPQLGKFFKK